MSSNISPKYQKNADGYTKWLNHKDVEKRRKAAMMVGELGVAQTIPKLIDMMENDPDKQVRQNARYSLGMFAAFRDAVESENEEVQTEAAEAIERLVRTSKIGQRAGMPASRLRPIMGILTGLLVLLLAGNIAVLFLVGDGLDVITDLIPASVPNQDISTLAGNARERIALFETNATALEGKLTPVSQGGQPGAAQCDVAYTEAEPLALSDADRNTFRDIAIVYDTLNDTLADFDDANNIANQACAEDETATAEQATNALATFTDFRADVATLNNQLEQSLIPTETPIPPTATGVPPTETPIPTATPNYNAYAADIYAIIDEVTGARGANTILEQYWQEAQNNAGETNGCRATRPDIPSDYFLPTDVTGAPQQLTLAIDNVNLGLQTVREGWDAFEAACNSGSSAVVTAAGPGLTVTGAVRASLELADLGLQQLRGAPPPTIVPTEAPAS